MAFLRTLRSVGQSLTSQTRMAATAEMLLPAAAMGQLRHMSGSKLFVGGLAWETDEMTLKDAFSSFGEVAEAKVIVDRVTGRSRGFGFVSFLSDDAAQNALAGMDGKFLGGRTIRVDFATQREPGFTRTGGNRRFGGGYRDNMPGEGDGGGSGSSYSSQY